MEVSSVTGHLSEVFVLALCGGPGFGARLPTKVSFFQSVLFFFFFFSFPSSRQFGTAQLLPGYYLSLHYGVEWSGEAVTAGEATTLSLVFDCGCIV